MLIFLIVTAIDDLQIYYIHILINIQVVILNSVNLEYLLSFKLLINKMYDSFSENFLVVIKEFSTALKVTYYNTVAKNH